MTKEDFLPIYTALCNAFSAEFDKGRFEIYLAMLKKYDKKNIERAIAKCIITLKFFPKIAEIVERIEKPKRASVGEMWARVMKVANNGGRGWEYLTDEEVVLVADCGGLKRIQNASEFTLNFIFNNFSKLYEIESTETSFSSPEQKLSALGLDGESIALLCMRGKNKSLTERLTYATLVPQKEREHEARG